MCVYIYIDIVIDIVMIDGQPDRCGDLWQWMMTLGSAFHLYVAYFFFNCSPNLNNNRLLYEVYIMETNSKYF